MRVAYVTPDRCGLGHAVRGIALVRAARRAEIELRAFGPPKAEVRGEYEGSDDWETRVAAFAPDLLLGDIAWVLLDALRSKLGAPAWLLLRWVPAGHLANRRPWRIDAWERRISIEPAADGITGITDRIAPIIDVSPLPIPADGTDVRAGYNAWWRATWFGYRDHVRWFTEGSPERQARIDAGGTFTVNGADTLVAMLA
jgi:hypothetical protein